MEKNKYDFIQEIFEQKNLTDSQRQKLFSLIKDEIKKDGFEIRNLDERVKILEMKLNVETQLVKKDLYQETANKSPIINNNLPKYYYPSSLYKYLFDYNQDPILKSTCHEIDSDELINILEYCETKIYDYEKHLKKIIEAFKNHEENHFAPTNVKSLIRGYITGKDYHGKSIKGWSSNSFKTNWSCDTLKNWCLLNPGIPPNLDRGLGRKKKNTGYEINPNLSLDTGEIIQKFSDLVLYFKHLFHIRSSNPLKKIITSENIANKWDEVIEFQMEENSFPYNIEFFTDVDKLIQAYNKIIELIIEQENRKETKPKVKLTLTEKDGSLELAILHKGSVYGKSIINTTERLGTTYENLIKKQINGVCNFYIRADFENDGAYSIGIWNKQDLWKTKYPIAKRLEHEIGGVEHIFEFVKPQK